MRVTHVVPDQWGPYVDVRACLCSLAEQRHRVSVIPPLGFNVAWPSADADDLFVLWDLQDPGPLERRDCYVAAVYSEALDQDESKMLPAHREHWAQFRAIASRFDAIFVHTPFMQKLVTEKLGGLPRVFVLPVGWDVAAMGSPRWDAPKHNLIGYRGTPIGRREIIPTIQTLFTRPQDFVDMTGLFGRALLGHLDTTAIDLYIAHSPVQSFSTWRLWQTASTTCVLVAEPGDTWPFLSGEHYLGIPDIGDSLQERLRGLLDIARDTPRLEYVARNAHALAREYTISAIHKRFVEPAFEEMRDR